MTTEAQAKQAFLDALAVGESDPVAKREGISPYFILLGGGSFEHLPGDATGFPIWAGLHGSWGVSHAAGRYQFQPGTWASMAARLGLTNFRDPAQQDAAAWDLATSVYSHVAARDLLSDLTSDMLDLVASALQSTWTSLNPNTFPTRYRMALSSSEAPPVPIVAPAYLELVYALEIPELKLIQEALKARGLYRGAIDATIGPLSRAALSKNRGMT